MSASLPAPKPPSRRLWGSAFGLVAALALAIGAVVLTERFFARARLDLTEQRLFTLSDGTRQIVAGLQDPITLRLFYSRRLGATVPVFGAYADRVREMLAEYASLSGGKIRLEVLDPEPFSETEDRALALGLQGVPVDQSGEQVYFGLAANNLLDDERTIPFFQPDRERFLEYDLTRLIFELSNPRRPVVGVLSSLPLSGDPRAMMMRQPGVGQPFVIMTQMRQFFTLRDIPTDADAIPADIQVLMVAHPQGLTPATLYAIDQYVMRGGKLLLLVDPHSEGQAGRPGPGGRPPTDTSSNLEPLLTAWGLEVPSDRVALDLRGAWRVRANPGDRVQAVDFVAWYNMQGDSLARGDVATAELNQVTVASAGEIIRRETATVEVTPLLTTSDRSMVVEATKLRQEPNPTALLADFRPDGQRRVVGARVRGELASAYAAGPPEGATAPEGGHRDRSNGIVNMVVINDADVLEDRFWVRVQDFFGQQVPQPFSDNASMIVNLTDTLVGGDAMISLRSRGESLRPFSLVDDMRRDAEARFRQTERELQQRLEATERRLRELRAGTPQAGAERSQAQSIITPEQRAEIDRAREEILRTRQQLRGVQLELRRDIETLERRLRIANIAVVPVLLVVLAIGLGLMRRRRRAAARG
ncbi:Gldg family protein [Humitalea sp. 24SJ18S-53]|uniref:Gldg family protein n=1 Tax=Humitalea sp. 24SJ18S-53 TaxID=3422307 RepID=UPI003D67D0A3